MRHAVNARDDKGMNVAGPAGVNTKGGNRHGVSRELVVGDGLGEGLGSCQLPVDVAKLWRWCDGSTLVGDLRHDQVAADQMRSLVSQLLQHSAHFLQIGMVDEEVDVGAR